MYCSGIVKLSLKTFMHTLVTEVGLSQKIKRSRPYLERLRLKGLIKPKYELPGPRYLYELEVVLPIIKKINEERVQNKALKA
jgi:hypothetical protein